MPIGPLSSELYTQPQSEPESNKSKRTITRRNFLKKVFGTLIGATAAAVTIPGIGHEDPPRLKIKDLDNANFDYGRIDPEAEKKKNELALATMESIAADEYFMSAKTLELVFYGHNFDHNVNTPFRMVFDRTEDDSYEINTNSKQYFFSLMNGSFIENGPPGATTNIGKNLGEFILRMRLNVEKYPERFSALEVRSSYDKQAIQKITKIELPIQTQEIFKIVSGLFDVPNLKLENSEFSETCEVNSSREQIGEFDVAPPKVSYRFFVTKGDALSVVSLSVDGPNIDGEGVYYYEVSYETQTGQSSTERVPVYADVVESSGQRVRDNSESLVKDNPLLKLTQSILKQRDVIRTHIQTLLPPTGTVV